MRSSPETLLQIQIAQALAYIVPPEIPWTAIGHGGGGKTRGALLKAMGVKPGIEDLQFLMPPNARLIAIELKAGTAQSDVQKERMANVRAAGGRYEIAKSLEEVLTVLKPVAEAAGYPLKQMRTQPLGKPHTAFQRHRRAKERHSQKKLLLARAAGFGKLI